VFARITLYNKIRLSTTVVVMVISVLSTYAYCKYAEYALFTQIGEKLAYVAKGIAIQIDGTAHSSLLTPKDESTPAYKQIRKILQRAKAAYPDIKYIYTIRPTSKPMTWEFVVDPEEDPNIWMHIGEDYDVSEFPELRAGLYGESFDHKITHDKWGDWLSGYAPIRDHAGRPVGIVAVDMSVAELNRQMATLRMVGIAFISFSVAFSLIIGTLLAKAIVLPIRKFIVRLNRAAKGDLETLVDDRRRDELGEVARTFNKMLAALKLKDKMLREMNMDYLTGLYTHRYFQQTLKETIHKAKESGAPISLMMLDLDRFKLINDTFGHTAGDEVLRQLAVILSTNSEENEVVARYGGEEFAILLPSTSLDKAEKSAKRLQELVAKHDFKIPVRNGEEGTYLKSLAMTISIGIACYPDHCTDENSLLKAADRALYEAKHSGRNCICIYNPSLDLEQYNASLLHSFVKNPCNAAVETLAAAVDARDHFTKDHSSNVQKYSVMIGKWLNLNEEEVEILGKAAILHDIGKIGIPERILNKPTELDDAEMDIVRTHCTIGEAIVRNACDLKEVLPGIRSHHERFDGKGYPDGLAGKDIPLIARIIAVADTFDALTTDRPHRRAVSTTRALEILQQCSGSQLDPEIVEAFCQAIQASSNVQQRRAA
jgi:diguanylate cyclase (GGDEF)-like protein